MGLREVQRDVLHFGQQVEIGGQRGDRAVEEDHVLHEEQQFLRDLRAVAHQRLRDPLQLGDELIAGELGRVERRLVEPEVTGDRVEIDVAGQRTEVAQRRQLALGVVHGAGDEQPHERQPPRCREPPGDAEVEQRGAAVGHHEEVAAVEVAVEDAVEQRSLHEPDHPRANDLVGVDAGVPDALDVVERETRQPLHDEHPACHQRRVWAGDDVAALFQLDERLRDVEHVLGFEAEVELLRDRLGEHLDQRRRVGECRDLDAADEKRREPGQHAQIARTRSATCGRCTLTTTSTGSVGAGPSPTNGATNSGRSTGAVHLCDRCRGERRADRSRRTLRAATCRSLLR